MARVGHTHGVPTVDPEPWFRSQRDERLAELRRELEAGGDRKAIKRSMRAARRDYRRAAHGPFRLFR